MQILRIANTIYIQGYMKKILLPIFIIFILFIFLFLGMNYMGKNLASLSGIITALVTINPLEVNVSAPAEVNINKVFKVEAQVVNKGEEKVKNARGEIFLPLEIVLLQKDSVKKIGIIPGKKEKKVSWGVRGKEIGTYIISVSVSGELRGDIVRVEGNTIVKVIEKTPLGQGRPFNLFQRLFDFFQGLFQI